MSNSHHQLPGFDVGNMQGFVNCEFHDNGNTLLMRYIGSQHLYRYIASWFIQFDVQSSVQSPSIIAFAFHQSLIENSVSKYEWSSWLRKIPGLLDKCSVDWTTDICVQKIEKSRSTRTRPSLQNHWTVRIATWKENSGSLHSVHSMMARERDLACISQLIA